jgi:isoquinoline 1-oxidoreductase beta subunit
MTATAIPPKRAMRASPQGAERPRGGPADARRRRFLAASAVTSGSLVVGFHLLFAGRAEAQSAPAAASATPEINAWVVVQPDDTVVIRIARSEMGQGTLTGLAQLVAEELECDWSKVRTEWPTPGQNLARNRVWGNFSTGGSRGIRDSHEYVRKGGAAARMMLVQAAADGWGVPVAECVASNSVVTHRPSGRTARYGALALAAAKVAPPSNVTLKDPKDWKVAGKRVARLDTAEKTTGALVYGIDVKVPGMLCAAIKDCPVMGGKVRSVDESVALKRPGVKKVVRVGESAVAVVADTWWRAKTALDALPIDWDYGPNAGASSVKFAAECREALEIKDAPVHIQVGDARAAIAASPRKVEAVYAYPHQAHATMEPMNATARYTPERCEVWTPTQNGEAALAAASETSGVPLAQCEVYKTLLGGGFGRRGAGQDWVRQAVAIAKELPGTPVKLIWSREEDIQHDKFHPSTQCKLVAGLDAQGNVTGVHMRLVGQSIIAGVNPQNIRDGKDPQMFQGVNAQGPEGQLGYTFATLLVDQQMRDPRVPPGFWRGVNTNHNAIYVECFVDEMAHAAGMDPLAFRRKHMASHPKHLAVLNAVAERVGWGTPPPAGVHRGLAQFMGFGSYVAACAEVSVSKQGVLKVHRIVAATDCGHAVNPQQIEAQVEGSFAYGLSAALHGECTVKDGRIEQSNFHDYRLIRMDEMPRVESIVMPSGGFWGGVGEPTIAVAAPAVLNAIFAATGKRIRTLPLKNHDLASA